MLNHFSSTLATANTISKSHSRHICISMCSVHGVHRKSLSKFCRVEFGETISHSSSLTIMQEYMFCMNISVSINFRYVLIAHRTRLKLSLHVAYTIHQNEDEALNLCLTIDCIRMQKCSTCTSYIIYWYKWRVDLCCCCVSITHIRFDEKWLDAIHDREYEHNLHWKTHTNENSLYWFGKEGNAMINARFVHV